MLAVLFLASSKGESTALCWTGCLPRLEPGFCQAFARLFLSLFELGRARLHCTARISHGSSSSPSEGMRAHEQTEWFVKPLPPENFFLVCRKIPQPTFPNTWDLKPHIPRTGMVKSLPQGLICSCSNKEKKLPLPEVSVFGFALPLVARASFGARAFPGRFCWS